MVDALSRIDTEEFIIIAAELLLDWDKLILLPDYNMCDHMSEFAICLLLQVSKEIRSDIWTLIS